MKRKLFPTLTGNKGILIISSIGYKTTEQPVVDENVTNVTISMVAGEDKGMEEVVVTALGIQRTAKSLTYSTQRISGEQTQPGKRCKHCQYTIW